eukprot:jgi/Chlat1/3739/Chrsp259S03885
MALAENASSAAAPPAAAPPPPTFSKRIVATDPPCIIQMQRLMRGTEGVMSLAQGIVHWTPPQKALDAAAAAISDPLTSKYGADDGMLDLRAALVEKLKNENGMKNPAVMVTAGANQAFTNVVVALCDASDPVVLFAPYYFNHLMALQMTGSAGSIVIGPSDLQTNIADMRWLREQFASDRKPKMVVLVNPGNPTGALLPRHVLQEASELCKANGAWLVMDNTYEYFLYNDAVHSVIEADHVINMFSMSKSHGMMGWRVGYITYSPNVPGLLDQLLKAQDTIPVCAPIISQRAALGALQEGPEWVKNQVAGLSSNRAAVLKALEPLGAGAVSPADGAIYLWAKLPPHADDDQAVMAWLAQKHKVCIIPGSSCGRGGYIRIAFANLKPADCVLAAERLKAGLEDLVANGLRL